MRIGEIEREGVAEPVEFPVAEPVPEPAPLPEPVRQIVNRILRQAPIFDGEELWIFVRTRLNP